LNWYRVSQQDYAWRRFQYKDKMFTRRKYTSHAGWQHMIDHWKLRFLIMKATTKWKVLEIEPVTILFNLYEFIRVLTNFSEYYERNSLAKPLQGIRSFSFKWQLHVHVRGEGQTERVNISVFGTGGEMLKTLSLLLSYLHGLTKLSLHELQLEPYECNDFIDDVQKIIIAFPNYSWTKYSV
uniref:FBD domain-containing protein n=1 Tax=Brugia timori TaxID=42155 RepID=A0A0R3RBW3_9BILA